MPLENRKRKKVFPFWERFNQSLSKYIPAENKVRKNKNSEKLLAEHKTSIFNPKFGKLLRGMEDKILGFQFKPVFAKPTRPSYKFQKLRHFV